MISSSSVQTVIQSQFSFKEPCISLPGNHLKVNFTPGATTGSQPVLFVLFLAVLTYTIPCMTKLTVQVEK